ncbi:MAG: pyrimidine dimer DNA glycosylase/endonuclease V, partial [Gammaproteobacteria bacterium]|nr:pyrimidine dimer DNA glycosylase/endonuclease V [Gammaproteobacteria bacterium]
MNPGYLNRQSLLGEHRELHGIVAIISHNKKGYSRHPETLRWVGYGWALKQRHHLLVAEMNLRGYVDRSPVLLRAKPQCWPDIYIDEPARQLTILKEKYKTLEQGRIPLP